MSEENIFGSANDLIESLSLIRDIAKTQKNKLSLAELKRYLGVEDIPEQFMREIYAYLGSYGISITGYTFTPGEIYESAIEADDTSADGNSDDNDNSDYIVDDKSEGSTDFTADYSGEVDINDLFTVMDKDSSTANDSETGNSSEIDDLSEIFNLNDASQKNKKTSVKKKIGKSVKPDSESIKLLIRILNKEQEAADKYIERNMKKIEKVAGNYKAPKVMFEDIVAEGNLSMVSTVYDVIKLSEQAIMDMFYKENEPDALLLHDYIFEKICEDIENMVYDENDNYEKQQAVLSKYNLLKKAEEFLTFDKGKKPSLADLCEYTGMGPDEIRRTRQLFETGEDNRK